MAAGRRWESTHVYCGLSMGLVRLSPIAPWPSWRIRGAPSAWSACGSRPPKTAPAWFSHVGVLPALGWGKGGARDGPLYRRARPAWRGGLVPGASPRACGSTGDSGARLAVRSALPQRPGPTSHELPDPGGEDVVPGEGVDGGLASPGAPGLLPRLGEEASDHLQEDA